MEYRFGSYLLDDKTGRLTGSGGEEVKLRPQTFRLLEVLVKSYPKIQARDELIDAIWGGDHVSAGSLPQAVSELRGALGDDPQSPRFIETVHRRGYRFIAPVSADLTRPFMAPGPRARRAERRRLWLGAAAAATLVAMVVTGFLIAARHPFAAAGGALAPPVSGGPGPAGRTAAAVLGVEDLSREPERRWLATALAEMIATELSLAESLRVVPGADVAQVRADLELASVAAPPAAAVERAGSLLACDLLVAGSYLLLAGEPSQLRVDLHVIDARDGRRTATVSETGAEGELFELVSRLGRRLRAALPSSGASAAVARSPHEGAGVTRALKLYFEGLAALRRFDPATARELLLRAEAEDPASPRVALALARARAALGEEEAARRAITRARELSAGLPPEEKQLVEALYHELHGQTEAALSLYASLAESFPDDPDYALHRTRAAIAAGRGSELLDQVGELRRRFPAPAVRARLDLLEAEAAAAISELARQRQAAARAAGYGRDVGARWLEAQALLLEARAVARAGDRPGAEELAERARRLFEERGDRHRVAEVVAVLSELAFERGDLAASRRLAEEAQTLGRELGNRGLVGRALEQLARGAFHGGEVEEGRAVLTEARALYDETGDLRGRARVAGLEAEMLVHRGDVEGARERAAEALETWRRLGDRYHEAALLRLEGGLLARTSRFDEALATWDRAIELFRELGDRRGEALTEGSVAGVLTALGRLGEARERLTRELAYHRSAEGEMGAARTLYGLAVIDLRTGRPEQARSQLEEALRVLEAAGDRMAACFVRRKLGDALLELGRLGAARAELEAALAESRQLGHRIAEGQALGDLARLAVLEGDPRAARESLRRALEIHQAMHDRGNAAGDRLALAGVELAEGRPGLAEAEARRATEVFAEKAAATYEAQGWALRARALARLGRGDEALRAFEAAEGLMADTEDLVAELAVALELERARLGLGQRAAALEGLAALAERARTFGYGALALEAEAAVAAEAETAKGAA